MIAAAREKSQLQARLDLGSGVVRELRLGSGCLRPARRAVILSRLVSTVSSTPAKGHSINVVALASFIGTTIEWYDFFLYGTAAALVFNRLFFPTFDPLMGILASFGTYAVGFVARPIGGVIIGHFGDKVGRKSMLVLTLVIMGVSTFLIGLLPTYEQIGPWAAVLLVVLRIAQGFGVGGEWGGAVLMAVEHAPPSRRGFYGSWPQIGVPAGLLLSTAVFAQFSALPEEQFLSWGWRVPFLLSVLLVGVGLLIRVRIVETPAFAKVKEQRIEARQPIIEVLRTYPKEVLLAIGARYAENGAFYVYTVFLLVYATETVKMDRQIILNGILLASACELVAIPFFGALSDRLGRRPVYLFGAVMTGLFAFPLFWMMDTGSTALVWLGLVIALVFTHAPMYGPQAAFFSELFGTRVRYSGASLGSQLASVLAGGLSPFIATYLLRYHGSTALASFVVAMAAVTVVAVLLASETHQHDIS
jgi:MFS transporter, MHS family, shikimate and dehydroshikimate transport protein